MTSCGEVHYVKQDAATSDSNYKKADDVNGPDHTNSPGISLHDAKNRHIDLKLDGYDVRFLLQPKATTDSIATGAAIVAVFLVALVSITAAIAVAILAAALVSCLRICSKWERARVNAGCCMTLGLEYESSEEETEHEGYEAELDG